MVGNCETVYRDESIDNNRNRAYDSFTKHPGASNLYGPLVSAKVPNMAALNMIYDHDASLLVGWSMSIHK